MIYKLLPATLVILQLVISRLSTSHAFSSPTRATTGGVDTDARKRTGKKSFLQRQSRDNLPRVATLEELSALATSLSKRRRGSNSYYKGWIHWRTLALDAVRQDLSMNLPHAANISRFENLFFQLGVASDLGRMPSFEDADARSGYAMPPLKAQTPRRRRRALFGSRTSGRSGGLWTATRKHLRLFDPLRTLRVAPRRCWGALGRTRGRGGGR